MDENKIESCCGVKYHKIAKFCVIILAALVFLGIGVAIGRHSERGDRGGRFDRFDRSGISQERSGCGNQNNFRGAGRVQRGAQEINQDQPVGQINENGRGGDFNIDAQINGKAVVSTSTKPAAQATQATQAIPAK